MIIAMVKINFKITILEEFKSLLAKLCPHPPSKNRAKWAILGWEFQSHGATREKALSIPAASKSYMND